MLGNLKKRRNKFQIGWILLKKFKKKKVRQKIPLVDAESSFALSPIEKPLKQEPITVERLPVKQDILSFSSEPPVHLLIQDFLRPNLDFKQKVEAFLIDQRSPHTRRAYAKDLKRFMKFLHVRDEHCNDSFLNRTVLIAYKEFLLSEKLEHTTVDRHLACLKSFFKWLVDDGILLKNPAEGVRFLKPKKISKTFGLSDEEVKKILSFPNIHRKSGALHYAILMILFYCGLRRSEVCELKTLHLGLERNQRILRLKGKGNVERIMVLIPPVWNAIEHYFRITGRDLSARKEGEFLFYPHRNNRTKVVCKPLDTSTIFYIVKKYAVLSGIQNSVSPHSCRATAISNARDHHVPDRAIQEFAGWSSTQMITTYDKRRTSIEDSAARSISYGMEERLSGPILKVVHPEPKS